MIRQSKLVLLLLLGCAVCHLAQSGTTKPAINLVSDDPKDNEIADSEEEPFLVRHDDLKTKPSPKPVSDEVLKDLIEASKHSPVLADDPRFNKMLPDKMKTENGNKNVNKSDDYLYYDYQDDYDDDYESYDETSSAPTKKQSSTSTKPPTTKTQKNKSIEMKPIQIPKTYQQAKLSYAHDIIQHNDIENNETNKIDIQHVKDLAFYKDDELSEIDDEEEDEEDEDDAEDDVDNIANDDIVYSKHTSCPRYCVCDRNRNNFMVATCSRLDPGTQMFGAEITDLVVIDVGPKYPILLGPEFFLKMGLDHVASIKISNCTIEYIHPKAFQGLDKLYSVSLTNVGLAIYNPDTFANNKNLRLLTISGNELSVMSNLHYILKSSSVEELNLSHNNLLEINPTAFSKLTNVVYINLSNNNLQKVPEKAFETVETLEELDLSYNSLKSLPANLLKNTSVAILHLRENAITHEINFGTEDLQQLDLSYNSIHKVHHGMFDGMHNLTNLNLRGNSITKIAPDSFINLHNLRHIDLSFNALDQVSSLLFLKNSNLDVIRLNDNPRLTRLPTDGFESHNGFFTVYYLDISNCDVGALGHRTFATMPHLSTLKMAWNNINNIEADTFAALNKLTELDLSNNLITHLNDQLFVNNNDLTKLYLSGNTIRKLSTRLFMPLHKLRVLDVSDCELTSLLSDIDDVSENFNLFETLRSFNASANQIGDVTVNEINKFKNLHTLDISRNPLKCTGHFKEFIQYVSLNKTISPNSSPMLTTMMNEASLVMEDLETHHDWAKLAKEVCKHDEVKDIVNERKEEERLEKRLEEADEKIRDDQLNLLNVRQTEAQRILEGKQKSELKSKVVQFDGDENENDDEEENESDYEEDDEEVDAIYDEDDHYDTVSKTAKNKKHDLLVDHGIKVEEIDLREETKDKFLLNKFLLNSDDKVNEDRNNYSDSDDEEIIIERGRIYYSGYKFLLPIIIMILSILVLLLVIAKIITMVMRKRGERYRMALLAASKNSIVYQKLTEDITAPIKESKQPKVHRYSPINQV